MNGSPKLLPLFASLLFFMLPLASHAATDAELQTLGLVSVKEFGAVGDGVTNDTAAIQRAIDAAKNDNKICLFPSGIYLVDRTLKCYKPQIWVNNGWKAEDGSNTNYRWKTFYLLGSSRGMRPVIKLKADSDGFNNVVGPITNADEARKVKPVINFSAFCDENNNGVWDIVNDNGNGIWDSMDEGMSIVYSGKTDGPGEEIAGGNSFYFNIRNIDFDLNGNKSAVGVKMLGAQHSGIQDIKVTATGAWGGFFNLAGSQCVNGNLEVVNGRVGIYGSGNPHTTSVAGVRLINQIEYAYFHDGLGTALVGFEIVKDAAPAVYLAKNGDFNGGAALIDGSIEFNIANIGNESPAIQNDAGGSNEEFFMAGVYIKNTKDIIKSGKHNAVPGGSGWKKIAEYAVSDDSENGFNLINGFKEKSEIMAVSDCTEADIPSDLRIRHMWNTADFPTPDDIYDRIHSDNDPTCAIITEHGAVADDTVPSDSDSEGMDNREAIQNLIDSGKKFILMPKGKFLIGKNPEGDFGLKLRENTILLGISHNWTEIRSLESWNPTVESPVITTIDSATAAPKMAFFKIGFQTTDNPGEQAYLYSWFNGYNWKAGKNSLTRQITLNAQGIYGNSSNKWFRTQARADNVYSGNAGGKHYGHGGSGAPVGVDEGPQVGENQVGTGLFRRFRIANTTQPLLLYNPNYEDGHDQPQSIVDASKNVVIYGTKAENEWGLEFRDCSNCAMFAYGGKTYLTINNCKDILIGIVTPKSPKHGEVIEVNSTSLDNGDALGVFKRGTFNWADVYIPALIGTAVSSTHPSENY